MAMATEVVESLKRTPKGQLRYSPPWTSLSSSEKQKALDEISAPPPILMDELAQKFMKLHMSPPRPQSSSSKVDEKIEPHNESPQTPPIKTHSYSTSPQFQSPKEVLEEELALYHKTVEEQITNEVEERMKARKRFFAQAKLKIEEEKRNSFQHHLSLRKLQQEENKLKHNIENNEVYENVKKTITVLEENEKKHQESLKRIQEHNEEKVKRELEVIEAQRIKEIQLQISNGFAELKRSCEALIRDVMKAFQQCRYQNPKLHEEVERFVQFVGRISTEDISHSTNLDAAAKILKETQEYVTHLQPSLDSIKLQVEETNKIGDEEKRVMEEQRKAEEEMRKKQFVEQQKEKEKKKSPPPPNIPTDSKTFYIPSTAVEQYQKLHDLLEKTEEKLAEISKTTDTQLKRYRFNLQKAVNTIGSAASQSGGQILQKINQIKQLLSGGSVTISGKQVTVKDHPLARLYCINLLAKKLVNHSEDELTPFPHAAAVVSFWCDFPEFGDLFLSHCHNTCPVLVPLYFSKVEGMSDQDHLKLLGYRTDEYGKETLFLKRMGSCVRLYAAVTQSPVLVHGKSHPHGLGNCWTLLVRILNTEPRPGITATALHNILEVAGNALMKQYKKQFGKLFQFICKDYLPKIKKVTPEEQKSPYVNLQLFLENCMKSGGIPPHKGVLSRDFWSDQKAADITSA